MRQCDFQRHHEKVLSSKNCIMSKKKNRLNGLSQQHSNPLQGKSDHQVATHPETLLFSLRDFDHTQGQCFADWNDEALLVDFLDRVRCLSSMTLHEACSTRFKIYHRFPPSDKTFFRHPNHITPDATWACFHISGEPCVAGHVVGNVFYIVFLDKKHQFWISNLSHT